ncbi:MAG TPA: hypothetical protein VFE33_04650 [Thermoanaerobaculia bacterium]|nr:hypothetical protein [Thermoanaerobaculia bacterium]
MNGLVTFYRDRKVGATYEVHLRVAQGPETIVFVYGAQRIRSTALKDREINEKQLSETLTDIRMDVQQAGGGVIAVATGEAEKRIKVETVKSAGFEPPTIFLALAPGAAPRALDVEKEILLSFGARLLIPGDAATQKQLESFVQYLGYLPLDLEMLVLDAIRRPSLDTRLMEVETRTFGKRETGRIRPLWALKIRAVGRGVVRALQPAVLMLLLAGLAVNGWWTHELVGEKKEQDSPPVATPTPRTGPPQNPSPPAPRVTEPHSLSSSVIELVEAVRKKSKTNATMGKLYQVQFKPVEAVLATGDLSKFQTKDSQTFYWGLIKLQALQLEPNADPAMLDKFDSFKPTKEEFRKIGNARWSADVDGYYLLAAAACSLGYLTPSGPGLPTSGKSPTIDPAVEFVPGGKCTDYPFAKSGPGLQKLARYVETLPGTKP